MGIKSILQANLCGQVSEALDNLVHERSSRNASAINNDGFENQISFLRGSGYYEDICHDEDIDALVHDTASMQASATNNDGLPSQIAYLNKAGMTDSEILALTIYQDIEEGCKIITGQPTHVQATHAEGMNGLVVAINDDYSLTIDVMGDRHHIMYDDIKCIA